MPKSIPHLDPDTLSSNLATLPLEESRRIAFCGASGTGKTTLAAWLSQTLGVPLNPVGSRSVSRAMGFESPYDVDKAGMRGSFQRRLQAEKIIWENLNPAFVTDRTTLDELVYTLMHDVKSVTPEYLESATKHLARYSLIVICPVDVFCKVGDDPARVPDLTYQRLFDVCLEGVLDRWAPVGSLMWLHEDGIEARQRVLSARLGLL